MYETPITVVGNVLDDVNLRTTESGLSRLSFRIASTARRKDRDSGEWGDGRKLFITVTFWREFAENVAASVKKGDPILVFGHIHSRQYVKDETVRYIYEIEPYAIGQDLARGVSRFERRQRSYSGAVEVDPDGLPIRADEDGYELLGSGDDFDAAELVSATAVTSNT